MDNNNQDNNSIKVAIISGAAIIIVAMIGYIKKDEPSKDMNINVILPASVVYKDSMAKIAKVTTQKNLPAKHKTSNKVVVKGDNKGTIIQADKVEIRDINNQ